MYCKNCGCKISTEEKRCSDCGIDIKEIEYCGGFWGLVGEEGKVKTLTSIEEKSKEVLEKNTAEKRKPLENYVVHRKIESRENEKVSEELNNTIRVKNKTIRRDKSLKIFLVGVVLIFMTVCLLQSIQISKVLKQCNKLHMLYEDMTLEYQELYTQYNELKEQLEKSLISGEEEKISLGEEKNDDWMEMDETEELSDKTEEVSDEIEESPDEADKVSDETVGTSDEAEELPEQEEKSLHNDPNVSNDLSRQFNQSEREDVINE